MICNRTNAFQNSNLSLILKVILFIVLSAIFSFNLAAQTNGKNEAVETLISMGYENVGYFEDDNECSFVLENSTFRSSGVGITKAIDVIQKYGLSEEKPCRVVVLDNNVPMISLLYDKIEDNNIDIRNWKVSYDLGKNWRKIKRAGHEKSSLFKVDVLVYPELYLKNLIITQIYQVLFNLSPAIEVSFWKGMKLTAQIVIPVYNDGYGEVADKVHPGFITLQQNVRFPQNIWLTATVGLFNSNRYGLDIKLKHVLKCDERFSFHGRLGITGTHLWDGFKWVYNTSKRVTWSLGTEFYYPRYNLQMKLNVEKYLLHEVGVEFEMIRHFRYAAIGFYGMKAKGIRANGGFKFQIALPPYKYKRKGYMPRIMTSNSMGLAYNAGNEKYYYKSYRANACENMIKEADLNPYFIKSELLNF